MYSLHNNNKMIFENKQLADDKLIFETTKGTKEDKIIAILAANPEVLRWSASLPRPFFLVRARFHPVEPFRHPL
jgi:hypothetical protein